MELTPWLNWNKESGPNIDIVSPIHAEEIAPPLSPSVYIRTSPAQNAHLGRRRSGKIFGLA
jgi:hypothetical protein